MSFDFTPEQRKMIRDSFLSGASDVEAQMLIEVARARRLDPLKRQIYFVKRWDNQKQTEVWSYQVSIDGLRSMAEETGEYDGQDEVEFTYGTNPDIPLSAKVSVYRKGISRPFVGVAHYREYVQMARDKKTGEYRPNAMWQRGPHFMLGKCAEAVSLRKAFPVPLGGLYTSDEVGSQEVDVTPLPDARQTAAIGPGDEISTETERDIATEPNGALKTKSERLAAKWDKRPAKQAENVSDDIPPPTDEDYRGR
jgi:phage recombination protein Bet